MVSNDNMNSQLNGERLYKIFILDTNDKGCTYTTIAVSGEWGCGKSTSKEEFIKKCKNTTDSKKIITVNYNALQFEEISQITSDLYCKIAQEIDNKCQDKLSWLDLSKRWLFVINKFRAVAKLKKESVSGNIGASYIVGGVIAYILIKLLIPAIIQAYLQNYQINLLVIDPIYWYIALLAIAFCFRNQLLKLFAGILPYQSHTQVLQESLTGFCKYYKDYDLIICIDEIDRLNSATVKLLLDEIWNIKETVRQIEKELSNNSHNIKIFVFYDHDILHDLLLKVEIKNPSIYLQKFFDLQKILPMPNFQRGLILFCFKLINKIGGCNQLPSSEIIELISDNLISFRKFDYFCREFYDIFCEKQIYKYFFAERWIQKYELDQLIVAFSIHYLFQIKKLSDINLINSKIIQDECNSYIDKSISTLSEIYYFSSDLAINSKYHREQLSNMLDKLFNYKNEQPIIASIVDQKQEKEIKRNQGSIEPTEQEILKNGEYHIDTIMAEVNKHLIVMQDINEPHLQIIAPRNDIALFLALIDTGSFNNNLLTSTVMIKNIAKISQLPLNFKYLQLISNNFRKQAINMSHGKNKDDDCDIFACADTLTFNKNCGKYYGELKLYKVADQLHNISNQSSFINLYGTFSNTNVCGNNFTIPMIKKYFIQIIDVTTMFIKIDCDNRGNYYTNQETQKELLAKFVKQVLPINSMRKPSIFYTVFFAALQLPYFDEKDKIAPVKRFNDDTSTLLNKVLQQEINFDDLCFSNTQPLNYSLFLYPAIVKLNEILSMSNNAINKIILNIECQKENVYELDFNKDIKDILETKIITPILASLIMYTVIFSNNNIIEEQFDSFGIVKKFFEYFKYNASNITNEFFLENSDKISQAIIDKIHAICDTNNLNKGNKS